MTAQKVISVPTERSMPPVMITNVQAIASTPLTAVDCKMPRKFSVCMKAGEAMLKNTSSRMRLAKASNFCSAMGPKSRAFRLETRPLPASVAISVRIDMLSDLFPLGRLQRFALRRQLHDPFLGSVLGEQFPGDAPLAHHDDPVAH